MTGYAILTDIEGTTSSIAFVKQVLFPFARARLPGFVAAHGGKPEVARLLADARALAGQPDLSDAATADLLVQWIDEDRKATPLKALQGMIWQDGYADGSLKADIYPDAVAGLRRWKGQGAGLYVYSSGSVPAQKLLFAHTPEGDLTPLFSGYFDTAIGGKLEADSYRRIIAEIGLPPSSILFLSDHVGELDAARTAGLATACLDRGEAVIPPSNSHPTFTDFDGLEPLRLLNRGA